MSEHFPTAKAEMLLDRGYGRRSLVETAIGRYKHIIASALRARSDDGQSGEVAIAVHSLNRIIRIAKPISDRRT